MKLIVLMVSGIIFITLAGLILGMAGAFGTGSTVFFAALALGALWQTGAGEASLATQRLGQAEKWSTGQLGVGALGLLVAASNFMLAGEDIFMRRDPSAYLNLAHWLRRSGSLRDRIDPDLFLGLQSPRLRTPGVYDLGGGGLEVQFSNGPSVLLAVAGGLGDGAMFSLTALVATGAAIIGAVLAVSLGVRRHIAAGLFVTLTASTPFIYVARSTYSEPYQALVLLAGLLVAVQALRLRSSKLLTTASFIAGSAQLFRVDGLLYVGLFLVGLLAATSLSTSWRLSLKQRLAVLVALALPVSVGMLDLIRFTGNYANDLSNRWTQLAALASAASLLFLIDPFRFSVWQLMREMPWFNRLARATWALLVLCWMSLLFYFGTTGFSSIGIWFGAGLILAASLGLYAMVTSATHNVDSSAMFVAVFVALAVPLYVVRPSIVFDQPWASRRLMGFAAFGLFLLASIGLEHLLRVSRSKRRAWLARGGALILGGAILVPVLGAFPDALRHTPRRGEYAVINVLCDALEGVDKVVVSGPVHLGFPIRAFCGHPTVYVNLTEASVDDLIAMSRKNGEVVGIVAPFAETPIVRDLLPDATATRVQAAIGPQIAPFHDVSDRKTLFRFRLQSQTEFHDLLVSVNLGLNARPLN